MWYKISYLFILFLIYSFLGYLVEIIACSIDTKKIVLNRGFFLGPYLPLYGISCILLSFFLKKYYHNIIILFILSTIICSVVEFIASYILEKIFKVRWWDYSHIKFNLEGRICLIYSSLFGLGGAVVVHFLNPMITSVLDIVSSNILIAISTILMGLFLVDLVISIKTLCKIKISSNQYTNHDATEEIRKIVDETLKKDSFLLTRLLNAFPKISGKNMKKIVKLKRIANDFRRKIKQKL